MYLNRSIDFVTGTTQDITVEDIIIPEEPDAPSKAHSINHERVSEAQFFTESFCTRSRNSGFHDYDESWVMITHHISETASEMRISSTSTVPH